MEIKIKVDLGFDERRGNFFLADFVVGAERIYVQALELEGTDDKLAEPMKAKTAGEKGEKYR